MLDAQKLFLDFSCPSFRFNKIERLSVSKSSLLGRQPFQGLVSIFYNGLCKSYDFCRSIQPITYDRPHPSSTFQNHKPVYGARTYPKDSRENRVRKLGFRLKTNKDLATESASDFCIEIQISLDFFANGLLTTKQIEKQIFTHLSTPCIFCIVA